MYKTKMKITSSKGSLIGGKLHSLKDVKAVLSKEEIEEQVERGHLVEIEIPIDETTVKTISIEELIGIENKSSLNVQQLKQISTHYKLDIKGNKPEFIKGISEFEAILEKEFDDLSDDELGAIARYYEVDETLGREEMILAIEELEE